VTEKSVFNFDPTAPEPRLRACKQCAHVAMIHRGRELDFCRRCLAQGHMYRMMTEEELLAVAEREERRGYHSYAEKVRQAYDALVAANRPEGESES
jgi:hypothetical protein